MNIINIYSVFFSIIFILCFTLYRIKLCLPKILYNIESSMLFHPIKLDSNYKFNILGNNIYEFNILHKNKNKTKKQTINALYFYNPNTVYTIIYAHGNGGNIEHCLSIPTEFNNLASVILFDYRNYGKSSSTKCIKDSHMYNDILSVWNYTVFTLNVKPNNIILYGHSLGSSVVSWLGYNLLKKNSLSTYYLPKAIIMQAGFSSLKSITSDILPNIVTNYVKNRFNSKKYVKFIGDKIKIIILHSDIDEIINIKHKDQLIKVNNNIIFYKIDGSHNYPKLGKIKTILQYYL
jgi:hypothetical protein